MKYAMIVVYSFAFGVLVRDVAQDYQPQKPTAACKRVQEDAERYAYVIAEVFNGNAVQTPYHVAVCRVKPRKEEPL